jgi:hypothetical protein
LSARRVGAGEVGTARFELATPCTPSRCATRLRHAPTKPGLVGLRRRGKDARRPTPLGGENAGNPAELQMIAVVPDKLPDRAGKRLAGASFPARPRGIPIAETAPQRAIRQQWRQLPSTSRNQDRLAIRRLRTGSWRMHAWLSGPHRNTLHRSRSRVRGRTVVARQSTPLVPSRPCS